VLGSCARRRRSIGAGPASPRAGSRQSSTKLGVVSAADRPLSPPGELAGSEDRLRELGRYRSQIDGEVCPVAKRVVSCCSSWVGFGHRRRALPGRRPTVWIASLNLQAVVGSEVLPAVVPARPDADHLAPRRSWLKERSNVDRGRRNSSRPGEARSSSRARRPPDPHERPRSSPMRSSIPRTRPGSDCLDAAHFERRFERRAFPRSALWRPFACLEMMGRACEGGMIPNRRTKLGRRRRPLPIPTPPRAPPPAPPPPASRAGPGSRARPAEKAAPVRGFKKRVSADCTRFSRPPAREAHVWLLNSAWERRSLRRRPRTAPARPGIGPRGRPRAARIAVTAFDS